ncbi:MAG: hypothetical protein ABIO70_23605 [Pseudomonadota bacterium]
MSQRPFPGLLPRSSFRVAFEDGRTVRWESGERAWSLHGHRPEGVPVVDLEVDGAPPARLSVRELRDLQRAIELLVARDPVADPRPGTAPGRPMGRPWPPEDDLALAERWRAGESVAALAERFGRTGGAIAARLVKLGLAEDRQSVRESEPVPGSEGGAGA